MIIVSRQRRAFPSLVKCCKPLPSARFSAVRFRRRHAVTVTGASSIRNISCNAPNALDDMAGTDASPKPGIPSREPEPLAPGTQLVGQSGLQYRVDGILQHRTDPVLACVYLATAKDEWKYVLKDIYHTEFEYQLDMQTPLSLRVVIDTVPEHFLFVYNYCSAHLLELAEKENLSAAARKRILRDALVGLADLHEQNILHGDIKPDNIFVDYDEKPDGAIEIKRVQVGDLEMGSVIPPGLNVRGARLGNPMWRSPEAHAAARINLSSDIFSFGLVCIYTMLRRIIFRVDVVGLSEGEEEKLVVTRLLSHFADGPGLVGLLEHLDDSVAAWRDLVVQVVPEFTAANPRRPFAMWMDVDEGLRDVVAKMTSLDPARRISAREALEHPWFRDVQR